MKILIKILFLALIAVKGFSQTPTAESKIIGPVAAYRGFHSGYKIPFLQILSADAKQTRAKTGFLNKKYPLIIALHGIGERTVSYPTMASMGTGDLNRLYNTSLPSLVRYTNSLIYNRRYAQPGSTDSTSFCYLFPQVWQGAGFIWPTYPYYMIKYAKDSLSDIIDTNRIYIVGLSFGGGGTIVALQDSNIRKNTAGAIAVCAGYMSISGYANDYKGIAEWGGFFRLAHSINDSTTNRDPITKAGSWYSDRTNDSILKYKGITVLTYNRWTTGSHDFIWDRIYNPNNAATNWPQTNGQTVNFLLNMHSQLLMFSNKGRRKVLP